MYYTKEIQDLHKEIQEQENKVYFKSPKITIENIEQHNTEREKLFDLYAEFYDTVRKELEL